MMSSKIIENIFSLKTEKNPSETLCAYQEVICVASSFPMA